ncbi:hypothetical protein RXE43_003040 [Pseudomonas aeruginosa]|uniref:hypothetical protein n=2 Tax=Pseudomonas aeruginosa TaxID=287 RepID=UPI000FFF379C|nr:hypothetical protein [Pseudomonas aeruginosa]EJV1383949.1 hypothetical protein [Pseudomonas aeruginosa]EJV1607494.1 hypothetical protein [Pseudomonas aeruginosa]EKD1562115.1 hypothetical protein [Pseudomonas aeruginosa]EKJ6946749.1 hypothetical protein [Pseudomonas aeruginosa]EKM0355318.1 hypothetical protein [Pseudomonas aeruginosa]
MKKLTLLITSTLLLSTHIQANSYCNSRPTIKDRNNCYRVNIEAQANILKNNYKTLTNLPNHTEHEINLLKQDHAAWENQVQQQCQSEACVLQSLMNRNSHLPKLIAANQESTKTPSEDQIEKCQTLWISAYRAELGEEAMVNAEQLDEWEDWCSEGKLP